MKVGKHLFNQVNELTPIQFYFPYFFEHDKFKQRLASHGISIELIIEDKSKFPSILNFIRNGKTELTVGLGCRLMIDNYDYLIIWLIQNKQLRIAKYSLNTALTEGVVEEVFDIDRLNIGSQNIENSLMLSNFVTFLRSDKIEYDLDHYDTFGILIISKAEVELIPFDSFNKTGGDHGYVWPAVARLDINKKLLYGVGMRMSNFTVDLKESLIGGSRI